MKKHTTRFEEILCSAPYAPHVVAAMETDAIWELIVELGGLDDMTDLEEIPHGSSFSIYSDEESEERTWLLVTIPRRRARLIASRADREGFDSLLCGVDLGELN